MNKESKNLIASVCVTSYNRVNELLRLLNSIDAVKYKEQIEIVISEDKSPKRAEIKEMVEKFQQNSLYNIRFNSNESNLGYDRNLGKLIELAEGKFIIFMSDDDSFILGQLDVYIDTLLTNDDCKLAYSPFLYSATQSNYREYAESFKIKAGSKEIGRYVYDSILFSGLTFRRDEIKSYDSSKFLNTYYFQVYMFLSVFHKCGAYYLNIPLVLCNEDGENGFGLSESSVQNEHLANRESIFSNIEFNKGLIKVIGIFDQENHTNIKDAFAKEYSLRSFGGLCRARKKGLSVYLEYTRLLESLDIKYSSIYSIYKVMVLVFGARISDYLVSVPRKMLISGRKANK